MTVPEIPILGDHHPAFAVRHLRDPNVGRAGTSRGAEWDHPPAARRECPEL